MTALPQERARADSLFQPGVVTGLLAPTGRERTALLRAAATSGTVGGIVVAPADTLFPRLDVRGNVAFALRARGLQSGERNRIAAEVLALGGLERDGARRIGTLGGFERALLLLARAVASARPLIVLDDLAAGLDGASRERVFASVRRLVRLNRVALVYATADRADALAVADRIAVAEGARVVGIGTPDELMADPGSAAVARAIGEANILVARVGADQPDADDAEATLSSGRTVPTRLAPGVSSGALCLLAVPPGRIAFAAITADRMGHGALAATLIDRRHGGTHLRLRLRLEDGVMVTVLRPLGSLSARDAAAAAEPLGASLAWRAADATAFPHPDA